MSQPRLYRWLERFRDHDRHELEPNTRLVLFALGLHMNQEGGNAYPEQDTLAERTGLSRKSVGVHLKKAVQSGWLSRRRRGKKAGLSTRGYVYRAEFPDQKDSEAWLPHPSSEDRESRVPNPTARGLGSQRSQRDWEDDDRGMGTSRPEDWEASVPTNTPEHPENTPYPEGGGDSFVGGGGAATPTDGAPTGSPQRTDRFAEFRAAYPTRSGGEDWPAAEAAWRTLLASGENPVDIMDGVRRFARYWQARSRRGQNGDDSKYIPKAVNWLSKRQWRERWSGESVGPKTDPGWAQAVPIDRAGRPVPRGDAA